MSTTAVAHSTAGVVRFTCPDCLDVELSRGSDRTELHCISCGSVYPLSDGIPRFIQSPEYASSFGLQWKAFSGTQLDSRSGTTISQDRFFAATQWPRQIRESSLILDAGCGAGRFAEVALSTGATVVAVDATQAVEVCADNLRSEQRLVPAQCDILHLPFKTGTFDAIYSLGVLQHIPDAQSAIRELVRCLKPGGRIVVDIYFKSWRGYAHPKLWLRPLTKRLPVGVLFDSVKRATPLLLKVSTLISKVPVLGRNLRRLVPVANYDGTYPLDAIQLQSWATLDTFDWLAPWYDNPATVGELRRWLGDAGLESIEVAKVGHLVGRGIKPDQ